MILKNLSDLVQLKFIACFCHSSMWSVSYAPHSHSGTQTSSVMRHSHLQHVASRKPWPLTSRQRPMQRETEKAHLLLPASVWQGASLLLTLHWQEYVPWLPLTLRVLGIILNLWTQEEGASLATTECCTSALSSDFQVVCQKEAQLGWFGYSSTGSAAPPPHLCFLVFTPGFVGQRGVRNGEGKNHLNCVSPRQI